MFCSLFLVLWGKFTDSFQHFSWRVFH